MHDIIGDIHENSKQLLLLPGKPGCYCQSEAYRHPEPKAMLLIDYIDRKIGGIRDNEGLYVGEQAVGKFRDNGNVYSKARRIGRTNHTRRICSGSQFVREVNSNSRVYRGGRVIDEISDKESVYQSGRRIVELRGDFCRLRVDTFYFFFFGEYLEEG